MKKRSARSILSNVGRLLVFCEAESDFWPSSRHFLDIGEAELAFEGLFMYLLSRDDLWKEHHALIKTIQNSLAEIIDFDGLELSVMDDGRYCEWKATMEWRQSVVRELNDKELAD